MIITADVENFASYMQRALHEFSSHFTNEEIEARKNDVTYPKLHSFSVAESAFEPGSLRLDLEVLTTVSFWASPKSFGHHISPPPHPLPPQVIVLFFLPV